MGNDALAAGIAENKADQMAEIIAENTALKAELRRSQLAYQMAMEMAQFQAGFLARTSHELRSPINSVISLHQLILNDLADSPAEERDFIAQSFGAAEKMLGVLDHLINVSKATHGTEQLYLQPLPLAGILAEVENLTQMQAKNRNLRLTFSLPADDVYVMADPKWFHHVLLSLVDQAIGLMREGQIQVTTEADEDWVTVAIADDRPPEFWQEPLDLLERLENPSIEPESPSSGLSLITNQTLITLQGGRLAIASGASAHQIRCSIPRAQPED
jgi:signal transduction histidine kinase